VAKIINFPKKRLRGERIINKNGSDRPALPQGFLGIGGSRNPDSRRPLLISIPAELKIFVDYSRSLQEMIALGNYNWVSEDITEDLFFVKEQGLIELTPKLIQLDAKAEIEEAKSMLNEQGLRPGNVMELLAVGATYPYFQRKFPIVALGSLYQSEHKRRVPFIFECDLGRSFGLDWDYKEWDRVYRLLAFDK